MAERTGGLNWLEMMGGPSLQDMTAGLNLVLLGKIGAGKSASGNTILGREAFQSKKSSTSVTQDVAVKSGTVDGRRVTVYDTPGLFNTKLSEQEIQQMINEKVLQRCESGPCVFLLVIKADRFTGKERETVEKIEEMLGEERLKKTWILFTRGDQLEEENMTIDEFINETEALKRLVQKYDQRYHVFNNKPKGQVQELLTKIYSTYPDTMEKGEKLKRAVVERQQRCISDPKFTVTPSRMSELMSCEDSVPYEITPGQFSVRSKSCDDRRIVLLGQTGVGKSAAGNTILGQREFISERSMSSVTSECSVKHATVSGRSVSVVDTPGLYHTEMSPEELEKEIMRSVYISSPGPHAFIIVIRADERFTEQDQQNSQKIKMFGEEVLKYCIILFTHGDLLDGESVEKLIEENCRVRDLVGQCGGRFHVFNNRDENNRDQVNDLLKKIDTIIEQNGGGHYSNQMIEDARRLRREEERRQIEEETEELRQRLEEIKERRQREEEIEVLRQRLEEIEERRQREEERRQRLAETEELIQREEERRQRLERQREERRQRLERQREERIQRLEEERQRLEKPKERCVCS